MYVAKILLPVAEGNNKTSLEVLSPLFEALHLTSSESQNENFGITFPNINASGFGNQINVYSENIDSLKEHINSYLVNSVIREHNLPFFIEKVEITKDTEFMCVYKSNKMSKLSPSAIRGKIKFIAKNQITSFNDGSLFSKIDKLVKEGLQKRYPQHCTRNLKTICFCI